MAKPNRESEKRRKKLKKKRKFRKVRGEIERWRVLRVRERDPRHDTATHTHACETHLAT